MCNYFNHSTYLIFFLLYITSTAISQTSTDANFFLEVSEAKEQKQIITTKGVSADKNEIALSVDMLYRFYKSNLSSQDGSRCSFYPSCADYCNQAIHKNGLIKGGIQALDRLTRCNGLSPHKYEIDIKKRKLLDDVH